MLLNPTFWLAVLVALGGAYGLGRYQGDVRARADIAAQAAQHAERVTDATDAIVVPYVAQIEQLAARPDADVGQRVVERVCPDSRPRVSRPADPAPEVPPDTADRLAGELKACRANAAQLDALIDAVRVNNDR